MHILIMATRYGIPAKHAERFEDACRQNVPLLCKMNPDVMFSLTLTLPPDLCLQCEVPVVHTVQREGEVVVTFPRAYHAGFSHGFNIGEAVNFATADWLKWGRMSLSNYVNKTAKRRPLFSQDLMVYKVCKALISDHNNGTRKAVVQTSDEIVRVLDDLERIAANEEYHQRRLTGPDASSTMTSPLGKRRRTDASKIGMRYTGVPKYTDELDLTTICENCQCYPFFSELRCRAYPKLRACPGCAEAFLPGHGNDDKYLNVLMKPAEIRKMKATIEQIMVYRRNEEQMLAKSKKKFRDGITKALREA